MSADCAIAGLVGPEKLWEKFDRNWMKVLDAEKITYFHAVDCERGKADFYGLDVMKRVARAQKTQKLKPEFTVTPWA